MRDTDLLSSVALHLCGVVLGYRQGRRSGLSMPEWAGVSVWANTDISCMACRVARVAWLSIWSKRCVPTHMAVMCWYICMEYECECSSACSAFLVWAVGVGRTLW